MTVDATSLSGRFHRDAAALGARRAVDEVFEQILVAYREPHRAHHGLSHLQDCLGLLDDVASGSSSHSTLAMALWFHELAFTPRPLARNEERSAVGAYDACLRMGVAEPTAHRIAASIRAMGREERGEPDGALLLDVHHAVLGADPLTYARYERDLRVEARWLPFEGLYRRLRAHTLKRYLSRPVLFSTELMRTRFEATARANISTAIAELVAPDDALRIHATDDVVYLTRAGRLEEERPWCDVYFVKFLTALEDRPRSLAVTFGALDTRSLTIPIEDPASRDTVARFRAVPGYRREEEETATRALPGIVYSRGRSGPIVGPIRLPVAAPERSGDEGPYRDRST